jgi:hypothetical protein
MKTYKKLHESKEVANIHIAKIKERGGNVKQSIKEGKILLEYSFKNSQIFIGFHGGSNFNSFEYSQIGTAKNELIFGNGFYFTSEKEMAENFAFKQDYGYVYTCEINAKNPLILTEKEIYKKLFQFLEGSDDENAFFKNISKKHDVLVVKDRKFGGGMKFSTEYNGFTEYVVYDKNTIKIINKERY